MQSIDGPSEFGGWHTKIIKGNITMKEQENYKVNGLSRCYFCRKSWVTYE